MEIRMASLALMVSFLIFCALLAGPAVYGLSFVRFVPDAVIVVLSVACIAYGFWWLMLPVWPTSLVGAISIFFGFWALDRRVRRRLSEGDHYEEAE